MSTPFPADPEADHDQLRAIRAIFEDAVNTRDIDKLAPILDDGITGVPVTGEEVRGMDGLRAYWRKVWEMIGEGGSYRVEVHPELSSLYGDLAVARGSADERVVTDNGREFRYTSHWTAVARRVADGTWKVLRMHSAMDPVNNPFVAAQVRASRIAYGAGGLVLGLLLGFLLTRLV